VQGWRLVRFLCVALAAAGWLLCVARRNAPEDYFYALFIALMAYVAAANVRYWVPLIPFTAFYIATALRAVLPRRVHVSVLAALTGLPAAALAPRASASDRRPFVAPASTDVLLWTH